MIKVKLRFTHEINYKLDFDGTSPQTDRNYRQAIIMGL